jgi:hypothetical protein
MDGTERLLWADAAFDDDGKPAEHFRELLLVHTLVDEAGTKVFEAGDVPAWRRRTAAVILRLFNVAQRVNLLRPEAVDDAVKNS